MQVPQELKLSLLLMSKVTADVHEILMSVMIDSAVQAADSVLSKVCVLFLYEKNYQYTVQTTLL